MFAVGWPMRPYGWVWNKQQGKVLAMAYRPDCQLLLTMDDRKLIVSLDDPTQVLAGSR